MLSGVWVTNYTLYIKFGHKNFELFWQVLKTFLAKSTYKIVPKCPLNPVKVKLRKISGGSQAVKGTVSQDFRVLVFFNIASPSPSRGSFLFLPNIHWDIRIWNHGVDTPCCIIQYTIKLKFFLNIIVPEYWRYLPLMGPGKAILCKKQHSKISSHCPFKAG